MALSASVTDSLKEAEQSLRNALAFAARQERPVVCSTISKMIFDLDNLQTFDGLLDKLEDMQQNPTDDTQLF
jgi:hypothetical protein